MGLPRWCNAAFFLISIFTNNDMLIVRRYRMHCPVRQEAFDVHGRLWWLRWLLPTLQPKAGSGMAYAMKSRGPARPPARPAQATRTVLLLRRVQRIWSRLPDNACSRN